MWRGRLRKRCCLEALQCDRGVSRLIKVEEANIYHKSGAGGVFEMAWLQVAESVGQTSR